MQKKEEARSQPRDDDRRKAGGIVTMRRSAIGGEQHKEEALAAKTLEGVRVEGRRMTTTIAAGASATSGRSRSCPRNGRHRICRCWC